MTTVMTRGDTDNFVQSTITALHTGLNDCTQEDRQKYLTDLLMLMQDLKRNRHPAAGALAAAVGAEILPMLEQSDAAAQGYEFRNEERWFSELAADVTRSHIRWMRGSEEGGSKCVTGKAFDLWQPPCFVRRQFALDLTDIFNLILKAQGRGRYCETHFFKPLSEVPDDEEARQAFRAEIEPRFLEHFHDMLTIVRGNEPSLQYQCHEQLKKESLEHGYYFYNDLDLSFVDSLLWVKRETVSAIKEAIHTAWDRDLPPEELVGALDELGAEADTLVLDCIILSTFYERDGSDLDVRSLHRTLIGTNRSMEVAAGLRPILFGELMRIPSNLAESLANPDPGENPVLQSRRFEILVRILSAFGSVHFPGLADKIVALAWGKPHLSGLVTWINDGCPEHARPFLKEGVNMDASRMVN